MLPQPLHCTLCHPSVHTYSKGRRRTWSQRNTYADLYGQGANNGNIIVVIIGVCVATRARETKSYNSTSEIEISWIVRKSMRIRMIYASRIYPID